MEGLTDLAVDVRTLFLAQTCLMLALAAMLWVGRGPADRHNGLRTWALGTTLQGLAYLLLAQAGQVPAWLSGVLANALGASSVALYALALRQFLQQPQPRRRLAVMVLGVTLAAVVLGERYQGMAIVNGYVYGLVELLNARLVWRSPRPELVRIQRTVALFFLVMGLLLPLRATALLAQDRLPDYLHLGAGWQLPLFVFGFLYVVATNLGFIQLCKARAEAEVREQMLTDGLTGLPNRRALDDALDAELRRAEMEGRGFAVLMVDVDHFKAINDRFGHGAGDRILAGFAARLRSGLGPGARGFRYGGEEFSVLLAEADATQALSQARALCDHLAQPEGAQGLALSASLGLALWRRGDRADDLLGRADRALYSAKAQGRNRVASLIADA